MQIESPNKPNASTSHRGRSLLIAAGFALATTAQSLANTTFTGGAGAGGGGGTLPWDQPLNVIASSLTGPVALAIAVIAFAVTGMTLVFGGELTDFAKRACYVVLAVAFVVGGASFMNMLFNFTGAVI